MPPSQMLAAGRARWCLRCASLFVLISGRALAALRLVCIDMIRRCRYATHRVVRFLPCTAATTLTVLLAPVRQEAARTRAVSSGLPSATIPRWWCSGRARCARCALAAPVGTAKGQRQPMGSGCPCAHGIKSLPGSCGDRSPTSVGRMDALVWL